MGALAAVLLARYERAHPGTSIIRTPPPDRHIYAWTPDPADPCSGELTHAGDERELLGKLAGG